MSRFSLRSTAFAPVAAALIGSLFVLSSVAPALAGTATGTITVNSTVANNCKITVTSPGTIAYDPIVTNLSTDAKDSSGFLTINCTKNDAFSVDFNNGANATGATNPKQMNMAGQAAGNTAARLSYGIYQGASGTFTNLWGTTSTVNGSTAGTAQTGTGLGPGTANKIVQYLNIDIAQNQNVIADSYVDTVTATITY